MGISDQLKLGLGIAGISLALTLGGCSSSPTDSGDGTALDEAADQMSEAKTDPTPGEGAEVQAKNSDEPPAVDDVAALESLDAADGKGDAVASKAPETPPPAAAEATPAPPADAPVASLDPAVPVPVAAESSESAQTQGPAPASVAANGPTENYSVATGDTLMKIAYETYGDVYQWRKIYDQNREHIPDPNHLVKGTTLKLEKPSTPVAFDRSGEKFMIRMGDTLGKISRDVYGTPAKWRKLYEHNRTLIKNPNKIFAGFYLYYNITPQEREEAEQLRSKSPLIPAMTPAPLAKAPAPAAAPNAAPATGGPVGTGSRAPASVPAAVSPAPAAVPPAPAPAAH